MGNTLDLKHETFRQACKGKQRNVLMEERADKGQMQVLLVRPAKLHLRQR